MIHSHFNFCFTFLQGKFIFNLNLISEQIHFAGNPVVQKMNMLKFAIYFNLLSHFSDKDSSNEKILRKQGKKQINRKSDILLKKKKLFISHAAHTLPRFAFFIFFIYQSIINKAMSTVIKRCIALLYYCF